MEDATDNFINGVYNAQLVFVRAGGASSTLMIPFDAPVLGWIGCMIKLIYTPLITAAPVLGEHVSFSTHLPLSEHRLIVFAWLLLTIFVLRTRALISALTLAWLMDLCWILMFGGLLLITWSSCRLMEATLTIWTVLGLSTPVVGFNGL